MAKEIRLPELGENVDEGVVVDIRVKANDSVNKDDVLMEVEAGKSTVEVPAPMHCKIIEVLVGKGEDIRTDQVLFKIEALESAPGQRESRESVDQTKETGSANEKRTADDTPTEESETQRETHQSTAPAAPPPPNEPPAHPTDKPGRLVPAAPSTRLLARELGVDLSHIPGSGGNDRVTKEDVKAYVRQLAAGAGSGGIQVPPLPDFSKYGEVEQQPLNVIRKETAKAMSLSWSLIPHVTQHDLADISQLEEFRRGHKSEDVKLTVTAFALKAVAVALAQFPRFNSSLDIGHSQLILKKYSNIGVAVDTEHGLLVPVIRDVDKKSILDLARELTDVADRARNKKLTNQDYSGGCFTISNLGGIGGTAFTPIIRHPETAILGLSRARREPALVDGNLVTRLMMPLSLSYDHRIIDGADAARFTRRLAEMFEQPMEMLLHA